MCALSVNGCVGMHSVKICKSKESTYQEYKQLLLYLIVIPSLHIQAYELGIIVVSSW